MQKPTKWGAGSSSWTLVWSLSLWVLILVSVFFFLSFLSSRTGEKEGLLRKSCRHEDSPVLFCHFYFFHPLAKRLNSPPFLHLILCEATSKAVGTTQSPSSLCFFSFLSVSWREGRKKKQDDVWTKASTLAQFRTHLRLTPTPPPPPQKSFFQTAFTFIQLIARLWKVTVSVRQGQKMETAVGAKMHMYKWRTHRSCDETQRCVSLRVTFEASNGKKRRLASCLQRLFTTRSEKKLKKNLKKRKRKYSAQPKGHFLQHCSSFLD